MLDILVFGATGQVAVELRRHAGKGVTLRQMSRAEADLSVPEACAAAVADTQAQAVINVAAYTAVDQAEKEEALATRVNGDAPGAMAAAAARRGVPFIHVSTDYVFDGGGTGPWREEDAPGPLGAYGRSKLAGERAVLAAGGRAAVLRTSWVFSAHGQNFVTTMLRVGATRDRLTVVDDQRGGPTAAADIAAALIVMARTLTAGGGETGIFHYAGAPAVTWYGFARTIFERRAALGLGGPGPAVEAIASEDWPTPTPRPRNSVLDCSRIRRVFGIAQPDWRQALDNVLMELGETT
jgi:dTDP-4-dehydrorhamnose reductase